MPGCVLPRPWSRHLIDFVIQYIGLGHDDVVNSRRQGSLGTWSRIEGGGGMLSVIRQLLPQAVRRKYAGRNREADKSLTGPEVGIWAGRLERLV